ncbi:dipeptidase [Rubrivirga marina]|uniref:Peptidase M19 n=1 Tax=Rubrivirga marina TaxID=1196024 RepID=A0A271J690_9BACT|nr:dipeptidase [Rubrivirga marina]PAP78169.1 peptidase M19 [Rubrivirga marina]
MRLALSLAVAALALTASGCSSTVCCAPDSVDLASRALALTQDALVVDTHIDVPYRLRESPDDISGPTDSGDFDHPRAVAGGLDVAFMSIYIPASYQETGGARALADSLIDGVEAIAEAAPDQFAVVRSVDDVARLRDEGRVLLALGMENGAPVEGDLRNLRHFRDRGIRYVTLTHSRDNEISDSSYDDAGTHGGLSDFGRDVVREMNRLGIMVDVSHISDAAFDDVMEVTAAPVIASHSSARHFTPGFERNLDDARIRRLAENGGVLQINFGSTFLLKRVQDDRDALRARLADALEAEGLDPDSDEGRAFAADFNRENPLRLAEVTDVADHIDHVVGLVGIDHVGLGSDYDGVGPTLPVGLEDVSTYPNLTAELLRRGYSEADIRKVLGENVMRVWREVEAMAEE